jgi:hypothetical protein
MSVGVIPDPPRTARLLHRALLGGLLTITAVFLYLGIGIHVAPLITVGDVRVIGYTLAAAGALLIVLALLVLKPRVPERRSGQDDVAFWGVAIYPMIAVWALLDAAGFIGALGALLTGLWPPAALVAVAATCLLILGPNRIESA